MVSHMKKIIGVFSGKGGVGKTTCTLNIGLAIHEFGDKVIIMDCDLKNANLGLHLGLYDFHTTIHDVLEKEISPLEAVSIHSSGLRIIPGSIALRNLQYNTAKFKESLDDMDHIVLFDAPSGAEQNVVSLIEMCDEILVVTNPDIPSVTDAMKTIQIALDMDKRSISMIVNRSTNKHELNLKHIEDVCKIPIIGVVPEEKHMKKSIHHKVPLLLYKPLSPASIEFRKIAANIIGKNYKKPRLMKLKRIFH